MGRRYQRQSARAVLVWSLTGFIGLQLGLALALEHWLPSLRDPYYGGKLARLRACLACSETEPAVVVALGSSRVLNGFKGDVVADVLGGSTQRPVVAINFGIPSAGPMTQYLTLQRLLDEGLRPDVVLIEILHSYLDERKDNNARWVPASTLSRRDLDILSQAGLPMQALEQERRAGLALPAYTQRYCFLSACLPLLLPPKERLDMAFQCDATGWHGNPVRLTSPESRRRGEQWAHDQYAAILRDLRIGGSHVRALRQLLDLCAREGICPVLLCMPESPKFQSWYSASTRHDLQTLLNELTYRYHAPLIDARNWVPADELSDGHHLLEPGARTFSLRLGRELRGLHDAGKLVLER